MFLQYYDFSIRFLHYSDAGGILSFLIYYFNLTYKYNFSLISQLLICTQSQKNWYYVEGLTLLDLEKKKHHLD
jgi:hypothetical protein